ncbi:MAG: PAS domain S-box protein [Halobacteria archaeon]
MYLLGRSGGIKGGTADSDELYSGDKKIWGLEDLSRDRFQDAVQQLESRDEVSWRSGQGDGNRSYSLRILQLSEENKTEMDSEPEFLMTVEQSSEPDYADGFYKVVFDSIRNPLFVVDVTADGGFRYLRFNEMHQELAGTEIQEIEGKTPKQVFGEEQGGRIAENYRNCVEKKEILSYPEEVRFRGEDRSFDTTLVPVIRGGEVEMIVGSAHDVTERVRREEELEEKKGFLTQIEENVREVVWISTPGKNEIQFISDAYEEIWGRSKRELEEDPLSFVDAVHPEDRRKVVEQLEKQRTNPEEYEVSYRVVQPGGEERWVHDTARGVYKEGELNSVVGIAQDVTERKRREMELQEERDKLETALSATDTAVVIWGVSDGTITWCGGVENMLGEDPEGGRMIDMVSSNYKNSVERSIDRVVETGGPGKVEFSDGEGTWYEMEFSKIQNEEEKSYVVGLISKRDNKKELQH